MTWKQIREKYDGQWVLIDFNELDEDLAVIDGEVIASAPTKEEIYRRLLQTKGERIAIEYAGDPPDDLQVMF